MKKIYALAFSLLFTLSAAAEVGTVSLWQVTPGKNQEAIARTTAFAPIMEEITGAQISVGMDQFNTIHWVQVYEDWEAWGKGGDALGQNNSEKFAEVIAKYPRTTPPIMTLADRFELNLVKMNSTDNANVSWITQWDSRQGQQQTTIANAMQFVPVHEKLGGNIAISADNLGNVYYANSFENWAEMGRWIEATNASEDVATLWASLLTEEPVAEAVKHYRVRWFVQPEG